MVEAKKEVKAAAETAADAAVKAEVKPAAPVEKEEAKAPAAKKTTARKTAAKKEETAEVKKAAEKKPAAKRAAAKKAEPKAAVHFQFDGRDIVAKDVLDEAVKAYKKTHRGVEIKDIQLYIVANEGAAYYVVNGEASDDYKILL